MAKRTAAGTLALAVCLGGGALALAGAANADSGSSSSSGFTFGTPIAGANRYETAIAAAKVQFPHGSDSVVIVNAHSTVDGLTASYVAGLHSAPILYTDATSTPADTAAEIVALGATHVYVVGGTSVVSQGQLDTWTAAGLTVKSYGGADRYATAALAAESYHDASGASKPSGAFVASGETGHNADALAAGPLAYAKHWPILLTHASSTPSATSSELTALGVTAPVVIGGTTVVSSSQVTSLGATVQLGGANRSLTAGLVADWAIKNAGFSSHTVALVGSADANAADALVAAPVAGSNMAPVLFAGTADTNAYLTAHASSYTGTGYVFGGSSAVSASAIASATAAAQTVVSNQSYVVTAIPTGSSSTFSYANPASQAAVKATPKSTDKFTVDGSAATEGAFVASLQVGGTVSVATAADGTSAYSYSSMPSGGYTTGLVGGYDTSTGGTHTLTVVEPVTGTALPFEGTTAILPAWDYTSGNTAFINYTVDGQRVSRGIFEGALSLGDTVTVSGTGADLSHIRTVALTSGSVTGTVASVTAPGGVLSSFKVTTAAGATFTQALTPTSGDTYMVDGASVAESAFVGTSTSATPVSVGDQITYSQTGGVQKFTLVNSAPSKVSGVVATTTTGTSGGSTDASGVAWWTSSDVGQHVAYSGVTRFVIDGTIASPADFQAAVTAGDLVTYQSADATTNTVASLTLVSRPLTGVVAAANSSGHTVSVQDGDSNQLTSAQLHYDNATSVYSTGTSVVYSIDGTTSTLAQFDAMMGRISSGARQGAVQVSISNGVVTWSLATTVYSAAPAITGVTFNTATSGTSVVLTFNKPVTASSAPAAADWSISYNGATATASSSAPVVSGNTITLTVASGTYVANESITVAPASSTTAAKYVDTYGTAIGVSSYTGTTS